jgi:regulator of protease activity HflC (stomatin/prohibitin superfamily)
MTDSEFPPADTAAPDDYRASTRLQRLSDWVHAETKWVVIVAGILLFLVIYFWESIFVTIGSGQEGVMYRRFFGGTVTDKLLGEGIHFVPPWDHIFVYNVRHQEVEHSMPALTQDGLTVTVNLSIRYRPQKELVGLLHQSIGPDYKNIVVVPEVEGSVRRVVGGSPVGSIYQNASGLDQLVLDDSQDKTQRSYIDLDAVVLRSIDLPKDLQAQIEAKMVDKEKALAYQYKLQIAESEAEKKRIDAGGVAAANTILNPSLTAGVLQWEGIQATRELAKSENAKTIVIGSKSDGLPLILGK